MLTAVSNEDNYFKMPKFSYQAQSANDKREPASAPAINSSLASPPNPTHSGDKVTHASHPLQINLVIQKIASFLDFKDLVNCSEVCRTWRIHAKVVLEKKSIREFRTQWQRRAPNGIHDVQQFEFVKAIRFASVLPGHGPAPSEPIHSVRESRQFRCQQVLQMEFVDFAHRALRVQADLLETTQLRVLKLTTTAPAAAFDTDIYWTLQLPPLPRLRKLVIGRDYLQEFESTGLYSLSHLKIPSSVKSLTLELGGKSSQDIKILNDNSVKYNKDLILRPLPELVTLKIDLCSDNHLYFVFNSCKSLKFLTIRDGRITNGFGDKRFKKPKSAWLTFSRHEKPVKSISGLKFLHKLTISKVASLDEKIGARLTNASLHSVLATCGNLKILLASGFTLMEEDYLKFSKHGFDKQEIFDEYGENLQKYKGSSVQVMICLLVKTGYELNHEDKCCVEEDLSELMRFYALAPPSAEQQDLMNAD